MKIKIITAMLLGTLVTACGDGGSGSDGGSEFLRFSILLSANCDGRVRFVDIFFDDRGAGRLTPGGSTTIDTTAGQHTIEGRADNGATFGPIERVIEFSGGSQTFTCNG